MARMPRGARKRGNRRARDQLQRGVVEDFVLTLRQLRVGIQLLEIGNRLGQVGVKGDQLAAAADDRRGHAHDVIVVQADHAKLDRVFWLFAGVRARSGGLLHDRRARGMQTKRGLG